MIRPNSKSSPTRRDFLKLAGAAAIATALPASARAADAPTKFENSASLYAWDLHDEGVEKVLDNLQQMAAVNSVYLIALMHPEKRPLTQAVFPHNPVRQTWTAEDARIYFKPDLRLYHRVKPKLSEFDWLRNTDWVDVLSVAAHKRNLKVGVELSHALVDKARAEGELADLAQRDIHGNITSVRTWLRPLCINNPATREYALALMTDLSTNHDIEYLQSAIISFDEGGPDKGGCFCSACVKAAADTGVDLEKLRATLLINPKAEPELSEWQKFRYESTARFYKAMREGVDRAQNGIDLRYSLHAKDPDQWGADLTLLRPHLSSIRLQDYSEQTGEAAAMNDKRDFLNQYRKLLPKPFPLLSSIAVRPKATPELIRQGVQIAIASGMDGITLGHYDGAEFPMLRAVSDGLKTSGH